MKRTLLALAARRPFEDGSARLVVPQVDGRAISNHRPVETPIRLRTERQRSDDRRAARHRLAVVADETGRERVEHQLGQLVAAVGRSRTVADGTGHVADRDRSADGIRHEADVQCLEQHIACGVDVERLERSRRIEHHRDGAGGPPEIGTQAGTESEHVGRLPLVLEHGLHSGEQRIRLGPRPRDLCRPGRVEQEPHLIMWCGREFGGALEVRTLCGEAAPAASPFGRALELRGDGFVGPEHGFGGMPRAPVGVAFGIEYLGPGPMRRVDDRRAWRRDRSPSASAGDGTRPPVSLRRDLPLRLE